MSLLSKKLLMRVTVLILSTAVGVTTFNLTQSWRTSGPRLVALPSGLQYVDERIGTGPQPTAGLTIVVHYVGYLENGQKFESSIDRGTPSTFRIGRGELIAGWDEGVSTMRVGGKRKLIIPPSLAYGRNGTKQIGPNATLIFEVELISLRH